MVTQLKINLSPKQADIVQFDNGALLVKAGPGSGKTRVVIERIKRLLFSHKRTKILALTFSNMAAEEMRTRIEESPDIDERIDNVTVGTIHSFCLDLVQTRGYLIGLSSNLMLFENLDDRKKVLVDAFSSASDLFQFFSSQHNQDQFLSNCLSLISDYKKRFISPSSPDIPERNARVYEAYNQQLLEQDAIDFDDILFYAYRILTEYKNVAKLYTTQYKYICVEEAQDLNYAQYEVIKALCGDSFRNVMMVGDENQSIYGFNGSDSSLMSVSFVNDFHPTVFYLNENFRSAKAIVDYANTLETSDDYPNCYYDGELGISSFPSEEDEAVSIISKIQLLMKQGHPDIESELRFGDFAIIARNKYVFSKVEEALQRSNIPYSFKKSSTGIGSESDIFKIFDLELRLLTNPKDIVHARELQNLTARLANPSEYCFVHNIVAKAKPEDFNLKFLLMQMDSQISTMDISDDEKYMALNDCNLWRKHWAKYTSQVPAEQRTLISFRNYVALGKTQISENSSGVSLLTAHMSKGLQYEVVFIIGLSEGTFPDYRAVQTGGKALEQEKNNMYVAVTRAKRLCYLSYPLKKKMPWGDYKYQRPSQFIAKHITR